MLRRRLSQGVLRAFSPAQLAPAPMCALAPTRPRSRSLASAVLLSSERNWKVDTVSNLKSELKKRGLSQKGNKATLVARLESAEVSSLLPPLPPHPNASRSLSTTARVAQPPKSQKGTSPPPPETDTDVAPGVTTTGPGPQVVSQRSSAVLPDKVSPEAVTVAPGLPDSKVGIESSGDALEVRIPGAKTDEEVEQIIPLTPDNFESNSALPSSPSEPSNPKVITIASASTHPAGGPVHATHEHTDSHSLEADSDEGTSSIPSLGSMALGAITMPATAWNAMGLNLPQLGLPSGSEGGEYKYEKRPLNSEERTGLWVLAGLVGTGLLVGGPKKEKKLELKEEAVKAAEAVGVKTNAK